MCEFRLAKSSLPTFQRKTGTRAAVSAKENLLDILITENTRTRTRTSTDDHFEKIPIVMALPVGGSRPPQILIPVTNQIPIDPILTMRMIMIMVGHNVAIIDATLRARQTVASMWPSKSMGTITMDLTNNPVTSSVRSSDAMHKGNSQRHHRQVLSIDV